jgi:hypothetical protein
MNKLSTLLQEIIDAGSNASLELNMSNWFCGTSCCACGDVAVARGYDNSNRDEKAMSFSEELGEACMEIFKGNWNLASSVFGAYDYDRYERARNSQVLSDEQLCHAHLLSNHNDREILHDYIRILIDISEKRTS